MYIEAHALIRVNEDGEANEKDLQFAEAWESLIEQFVDEEELIDKVEFKTTKANKELDDNIRYKHDVLGRRISVNRQIRHMATPPLKRKSFIKEVEACAQEALEFVG